MANDLKASGIKPDVHVPWAEDNSTGNISDQLPRVLDIVNHS